ncbi:MAG TPA: ABC transporter permease, partial [Agrobacterium sp.]|nr:ABC transporter permease [Agrobacterium sp.]
MALCNYLPDMLCKFPAIDNSTMRVARKTIDDGFRDIVRNYGDAIDVVVHPLQLFLNSSERLFIQTPWIITMLVILAIVHLAGRSFKITGGTAISLLMIGAVG